MRNKKKTINDPIYGFLTIPYEIIFDLTEHPYFQRLRRIKQLGLSHLVFPGAQHTRFHHALGALFLTIKTIEVLRQKEVEITEQEAEALCIAILLHDIGHGPFSHALEQSIVSGIHHEQISKLFMTRLNEEFDGKLSIAIQIFENSYPKKFLNQIISSQLDMDRMDYLNRDSFYAGVSEGVIGAERIIHMLNVANDELVVEEKGIYSVEKFLVARRLMYWQVYLHKTVIAAETLLVNLLKRARELSKTQDLYATPALKFFLQNEIHLIELYQDKKIIELFSKLDDFDIIASVKVWADVEDRVLSRLCQDLLNRNLPKVEISNYEFDSNRIFELQKEMLEKGYSFDESAYFVFSGSVQNSAYIENAVQIKILKKDGSIIDISKASDNYNINALKQPVQKYYLCYPK